MATPDRYIVDLAGTLKNTFKVGNSALLLESREVNTLVGDLAGGGDLSANRTLSLATTGVIPTTYGSAAVIPEITVDSKGRITAAVNRTITPGGIGAAAISHVHATSDITNIFQYGITGVKSITGGGTLAANRTMELVNDALTPGNTQYYGTNGSGTKGWFSLLGQNLVGLETTGITGLLTLTKAGTSARTLTAPDATGTIRLVEDIYAFLGLSTSAGAPAYGEGKLYWDSNDHTLALMTDIDGVTIQVGQEEVVRVKNQTGSPITNGQVVYVNGANSSRPTIDLALATSVLSNKIIGLCTYDIANNAFGYVCRGGLVRNLDTFAWAVGDELYVSDSVAGAMTNVAPTAPNHAVRVGYVLYSHATDGIVMVHVDVGNSLNDLHDVYISSVADKHALRYVSANTRWENSDKGAWIDTAQTFTGLQTFTTGALVGDLTSTYMVVAGASGRLANSAIIQGSITGAMTISKTGTTAREYTFPDAATVMSGSAVALTSGRVPFVTTGGLLTDSATLTFSGSTLVVGDATGACIIQTSASVSTSPEFRWLRGGNIRWRGLVLGTESGSDSGGNWALRATTDAGVTIDDTISIVRAVGGAITLARPVTCSSTLSCTSITASGLTSGRVPYVTTGGLLTNAGTLKFASSVLTVGDGTGAPALVCDGAAGAERRLLFRSGSTGRWDFYVDSTAESGADTGSAFVLNARTDAGASIGAVVTIVRAAGGAITLARPVSCSSTLSATSLTATGLSSGRVPFATAGGLLTDDAFLTYTPAVLTVGNASSSGAVIINGTTGGSRAFYFRSAGSNRATFGVSGTESGSNSGSNFGIDMYTDASAYIDTPFSIVRAAGGAITLARPVTCTGVVTVPNGTAAAPGIRLTTEASGLYRISSTSLGFAVAGVAAASLTSTGQFAVGRTPSASTSGAASFYITAPVTATLYDRILSTSIVGNNDPYINVGVYSDAGNFANNYARITVGDSSATRKLEINSVSVLCYGTVTVPNGTAAAPGLRLTSEASGLYRVSATSLGISVAGVVAAYINEADASASKSFVMRHTDAALPVWITNNMADGSIVLGGPTASGITSASGQVRVYGSTHATKSGYVEFTRGATVSAFFNGSGVLTLNTTTDASVLGTAAIVGLGGLSIAKNIIGGQALNLGTFAAAQLQSTAGRMLLSSSATDVTSKVTFILNAHYTNAEEPFGTIIASSNNGTNLLRLGGGSVSYNAATSVAIYTGVTSDTVTGTDRFNVDANGIIAISNTTDATTVSDGSVRIAGGLSILKNLFSGGVAQFRKDQNGDTYVRVYNTDVGTSAMARFAVNTSDRSGQLSCHSSTASANTGYLALIADSATNLMLSAAGASKHVAIIASSGEVARFDVDGLTIASTKSIVVPVSTSYQYFGLPGTDGSVRVYGNAAGAFIVEKRVAGSWVEAGRFA